MTILHHPCNSANSIAVDLPQNYSNPPTTANILSSQTFLIVNTTSQVAPLLLTLRRDDGTEQTSTDFADEEISLLSRSLLTISAYNLFRSLAQALKAKGEK